MNNDMHFMRHALSLAARNIGQTWPNPAVGALVVKDNRVLGAGWTARSGRPHAEPQALAQAGNDARGATLYVTLEPCAHQGKTPPCTEGIIAAGIARLVVACTDPHTQVNGQGITQLRKAGIEITESVCAAEALALNAGFFSVIQRQRPYVALKIATSLDGKIATANGQSRWITGNPARTYGHLLRSQHDAIMTGIGTVMADDPLLTCRLSGLEDRSPVRVVMDRKGQMPKSCKLMQTAQQVPVWTFTTPLPETLCELAGRGITRLMVEAGRLLTTAFLREHLIDRIYWFRAPMMIGNDGGAAVETLHIEALTASPRYRLAETMKLGTDTLEVLECLPA